LFELWFKQDLCTFWYTHKVRFLFSFHAQKCGLGKFNTWNLSELSLEFRVDFRKRNLHELSHEKSYSAEITQNSKFHNFTKKWADSRWHNVFQSISKTSIFEWWLALAWILPYVKINIWQHINLDILSISAFFPSSVYFICLLFLLHRKKTYKVDGLRSFDSITCF
jgi:hypothetical protein